MHLLVMSDLHLEHHPVWKMPESFPDFDVGVFAGDIDSPPAKAIRYLADIPAFKGKDIIYLPGNHEFYHQNIDKALEEGSEAGLETLSQDGAYVWCLNPDMMVGLNGVRFVGSTLWTDYNLNGKQKETMGYADRGMNDHRLIRTGLGATGDGVRFTPTHALERHKEELRSLRRRLLEPYEGKTVVVTHHGPGPGSVHPRFANDILNGAFNSDLTDFIEEFSPDLWIHGHTHDSHDYKVRFTRVVCNPKGYGPGSRSFAPENIHFNQHLIIEV